DFDALAAQHGGTSSDVYVTINKGGKTSDIEFDQIAKQFGGVPDDLSQAGRSVDLEDPNTIGTFARHVGAQINPLTAIQTIGNALPLPKALGGQGVPLPQSMGGSGLESG